MVNAQRWASDHGHGVGGVTVAASATLARWVKLNGLQDGISGRQVTAEDGRRQRAVVHGDGDAGRVCRRDAELRSR